jgi:radical SAM protein with 4Fe4S-binding SPASM domain
MSEDKPFSSTGKIMNNIEIIQKIGIVSKDKFKQCIKSNQFYSPLFVKIKPLGKCNLKCKKCNYWRRDSHAFNPGLSKEKIISLVDELTEMGCKCIKLSGGEVTLFKDLPEIVKYVKLKDIICSITSNGVLIDNGLAMDLISAGLDKITISLDSHNQDIHDSMVGLKGSWERSVNALQCLVSQKKLLKSQLRITVATVISKLNYNGLDNLANLLSELNVARWDLLVLVSGHLEDTTLFMDERDIRVFNREVLPKINEKSNILNITLVNPDPFRINTRKLKNVPLEIYNKIPCYVGWYSFLIHFNGMVALCCANKEFQVGDVYTDRLRNIINNETSTLFRRMQQTPNKPFNCFQCFDEVYNNLGIHAWVNENEDNHLSE